MKHNPEIHNRKSIRLKGYDYSKKGLYFITICTQNREHLFGEIIDGKMILNSAGEIAFNEWFELKNRFNNIELYGFIVMPNHIHGIIEMIEENEICTKDKIRNKENHFSKISPKSNSLSLLIRSYKSCVSKKCRGVIYNAQNKIKQTDRNSIYNTQIFLNGQFQWQRNYYDNIIRNEKTYLKVSEYIKDNPLKWAIDKYYNKTFCDI